MIDIANLSVAYGKRVAIDIPECTVGAGLTYILGPNGAGKSTFLQVLSGVIKPTHGNVEFLCGRDGDSLHGGNSIPVSYLPQRFSLLSWASAFNNVRYAAWVRGLTPA